MYIEHAVLRYPVGEAFRQLPVARIAQHQLAQHVAVMVDQLTGHNQPAFVAGAAEVLEVRPQQLRQLAGKAGRERIRQAIVLDKGGTRFSGVREDEAHLRRAHHHDARVGALVLVQPVELIVEPLSGAELHFALLDFALKITRHGRQHFVVARVQAVEDGFSPAADR